MNRSQTTLFILPLILAALACTLTQPTGAELLANPPTQAPTLPAAPRLAADPVVKQRQTTSPAPITTPALTICSVTAAALNVRACPGVTCAAVAWLTAGETITTTQPITAWAKVPGGWINSSYLECTK